MRNSQRLSKNRSRKILPATMRSIAGGEEFETPATNDQTILDKITEALGYLE